MINKQFIPLLLFVIATGIITTDCFAREATKPTLSEIHLNKAAESSSSNKREKKVEGKKSQKAEKKETTKKITNREATKPTLTEIP